MSTVTPPFPLPCPCGSGSPYEHCCEPYLQGKTHPPTAEALMRSRYTAYTCADLEYLLQTWHPDTRPKTIDQETIPHWYSLRIIATTQGGAEDTNGTVEFLALARADGRILDLHEKSCFVQKDGIWLYHSGETPAQTKMKKPGRNSPCPCGSGKKYKKCCA